MKPIFFIDYDNTIFSHFTWSIPESAFKALSDLQSDGFKVAIASGRLIRSNTLPAELEGRFAPDCLVSSNGAVIDIEGKPYRQKYFSRELQSRIMDYALEHDYCIVTSYEGGWYTSAPKRYRELATNKQRKYKPVGGDAFRMLYEKPLPAFFVADTEEVISAFERDFPETKLLRMGTAAGGADIIPRENGKTQGAIDVLDYYGMTLDDAVAIGDSMNDIELIKAASFGIAMGNAMKEVRDAADFVTDDIDDDGLAKAVAKARAVKGYE